MNEPNSRPNTNDSPRDDDKPLAWTAILNRKKKNASPQETGGGKQVSDSQDTAGIQKLWGEFRNQPFAKQIELMLVFGQFVLGVTIFIFSIVQIWVVVRNNSETSYQADQLIAASKYGAFESQQNARAASDFSSSARSINTGIEDAVGKLNIQAAGTQSLAQEAVEQAKAARELASQAKAQSESTKRLADDEEKAARPWMGIEGHLILDGTIRVTHDQVPNTNIFQNSMTVGFHYVAKNFGKDPAFLVNLSPTIGGIGIIKYEDYIADIQSRQDRECKSGDEDVMSGKTKPNGAVVFPGSTFSQVVDGAIAIEGGPNIRPIDQKYPMTIVGCISYQDQFKALHHTRFCYKSIEPISALVKDTELRQCSRNQYAD